MPFAPTDVSGCILWLDASTLGLSNNDPVGTWPDGSGNANDAIQAVAGAKPLFKTNIINSLPAVEFDTTDDGMLTTAVANNPFTIFLVEKSAASGSNFRSLNGASANRLVGPCRGDGNNLYLAGSVADFVAATDTPHIVVARGKAAGALYIVDGTDQTDTTGNTNNFGAIALGASGLFAEPAGSKIAEVIAYDNDIGDTNYNAVGWYLQQKWGISAGYTDPGGGGGPTQKNAVFGEVFRAPFAKPFGG